MAGEAITPGGILGFRLGWLSQDKAQHERRGDRMGDTFVDTLEPHPVMCRLELG